MVGDKTITLHGNESTYIPLVQTHRLSNPGNEPVEIVEAVWALLGEDDIIRLDDNYGRKRDS
jgi:mannose-1-phosphate guanylyltransferase/mannose-6-phosphate isomerase